MYLVHVHVDLLGTARGASRREIQMRESLPAVQWKMTRARGRAQFLISCGDDWRAVPRTDVPISTTTPRLDDSTTRRLLDSLL